MNLRRQNAIRFAKLLSALIFLAISLVLLTRGASYSVTAHVPRTTIAAQDEEKSLDINRYPNEPLELVDLKIGENSVKERIRPKIKNNNSRLGVDNVKFKEKNDWFKNVKVTLRNISGRPIYGLDVSLLFRPLNLEVGFRVSVKESQTKNLKSHPLEPGEELDLGVDNHSLKLMLDQMLQNGVDANQSTLGLSVDGVSFGDDFGWRKGSLMRRNAADPKKWDVVDKPDPSPTPSSKLLGSHHSQSRCNKIHVVVPTTMLDLKRGHVMGIKMTCATRSENQATALATTRSLSNYEPCLYCPGPSQLICLG